MKGKRITALLLCVLAIIGLLPTAAFAAGNTVTIESQTNSAFDYLEYYVNLSLDNDEQGREATASITEFLGKRYKVYDHPPINGKDYNEDLLYRQEQFKVKKKFYNDHER